MKEVIHQLDKQLMVMILTRRITESPHVFEFCSVP